jgi:regulator of sirC expression with transglutaminase-like and TPR domain
MRQPDPARLTALVSLLKDENPRVVAEARRALRGHGAAAVPFLESASGEEDAKLRSRARLALEDVRVHLLVSGLRRLCERIDRDPSALEEGCILIARSHDPDLDPASVRAALDAMADDLDSRLPARASPTVVVNAMSRLLARELGFHGNHRNYYDPDNSYLHKVLERRTGIPISLSAVYLFVARRLGIPLLGVGLPGHFVLRHAQTDPPLFLDPFAGGRVLSEVDCRRIVAESDSGFDLSTFLPISDGAVLLRMIRNLLLIYRNRGDVVRRGVLARLKGALIGEEVPGRELPGGESSS